MMIIAHLERAVCLMASGSYIEAVSVLDQTLQELRTNFLAQEEELVDEADSASLDELMPSPTLNAILGPICAATACETLSTGEYPIYKRAMLVSGMVDESVLSNEVNVAVISAVVLFNKGLIFHILGQGNSKCLAIETYITRARTIYNKALCLITACSPSTCDNFWLKSILLNNLGQICFYKCDRTGEQLCLMEMEKLLIHRVEDNAIEGEETDLQLNVVLLFGVHRPSPAA
ncbi:hypothetical protein MPSEU_000588700 [Mayamaea pseudoterrestris]|nr:hypothetical protein MPSEU_000588700 [Mayamaea pseudoterrestris]